MRMISAKSKWVATIALFVFSAAALADTAVYQTSQFGPPSVSIGGCPHNIEWTDEAVAKALGLDDRVLHRLNKRFGVTAFKLCTSNSTEIQGFLRHAKNPKHNADQPDGAYAFRAMQLRDENGEIRPNGLLNALAQRQAVIERPPIGGKSLEKAAGVTSTSWTWLGPGNIGGRVRAISPHPTVANEILIGSVSGGLWKTTDGGVSWSPLNDFMPNVAISCLVRDPANANIIFACTGEGAFNVDAVRGLGIFKSTDNGTTWSQLSSTNPPGSGTDWYYVNRLAIHPSNSQIMLAATNGGVYQTTNGGASWTKTYGAIPSSVRFRRVYDVAFHPTDGNIALLGEHRYCGNDACSVIEGTGVAYSADGGATWTRTRLSTATLTGSSGRVEIAYAKSNPSIVYASVDVNSGQLFKSVNGGQTWTVDTPVNSSPTNGLLGGQGWYDNAIWVAPNDPNRVIVAGVFMRMSIDGGVTFTSIASGVHVDHHALVSDPGYGVSNFTIYNGNDGGLYRATGVNTATPSGSSPTWTSLNNGLGITQFYGGAGKSGGAALGRITGGTQDNGSLLWTGSTNWVSFFGGDGGDSAADPNDGNYIYGETQNGGIVRSSTALAANPTGSGQTICTGILDADCIFGQNPSPRINFIPPIRLDPNNSNVMLVGAERLWKSSNIKASPNTSVTWSVIREVGTAGNYISAIAIAQGNSDIIWVGYNNGQVACTTNGTAATPTWTIAAGTPSGRMVTRITIDESNNSRVFIANGGYASPNLHVTTSGCVASPAYTAIHNQLPAAPIRAITRHPGNANWLYAGTEVGMFASEDGGASWTTTNDGPGTVSVEELFFIDGSTLVASTHGRGMFQATANTNSPGTIQFSIGSQSALESAGTITVSATRTSGVTGAVTVNYATANGSATAGQDYSSAVGTLSWANGEGGSKSFTIPVLTDSAVDPNETLTVALSSPSGGAVLGSPSVQTITLLDTSSDVWPKNCLLPAGFTQTAGATTGWSVATDSVSEGTCSLKSNPMGNAASPGSANFNRAQIEFTGTFVAGNVSFARRVSSETNWDCMQFYIDGIKQNIGSSCTSYGGTGLSGEVAWAPASIPITAGVHTIRWSFEKDETEAGGSDAAWIDAVVLPLNPASVALTSSLNPSTLGQLVTFTAAVSGSAGVATGAVEFRDGSNTIGGCGNVALVSGQAQCATSALPQGARSITAHYSGSTTYNPGTSSALTQTVNSAPAGTPKKFDFNGDSRGDILLRQAGNGQNYLYPMNGTAILASEGFIRTVPAPWVVAGVGDFDGDGKADILWRNTTTGENYLYFMNGTTILASEGYIRTVPTVWTVGGIGDFDGDGKADILWRNTSTGENYLYFMDGKTIKATEGFIRTVATTWIPATVADFDGDGKADILWRNATTGENYMYPMDGKTIKATEGFIRSVVGSWIVAGSGDFTGDGKADILWRNTTTGENYIYPMDGRTILATEGFIRSVVTAWIAASVTDFDGDGKADILWRNTTTGENYIYPMDGRTIKATEGFTRTVPTSWSVVTK